MKRYKINPAYLRKRKRGMKRRRRRSNKRVRSKKTYVHRFHGALGNFPSTKTVALRYVANFALDASGGSSAIQVFSANSCFDPDVSGTGHQPMFFDNYSALYSNYRVNRSTITVVPLTTHAVNTTSGNLVAGTTVSTTQYFAGNERGCRLFIIRDPTSSDYTSNLDNLVEEGNTNFVWRYCPQNTAQSMPILRFSCWPHILQNVSFKDDRLQANVTGDPPFNTYYIVGVASIGNAANPDSIACQAIITYNVTFSNLKKNQAEN